MKILGVHIPFTQAENKVQTTPEQAYIKNTIKVPQQVYRISTDLAKYKAAVQSAESIYNPQRYQYYQLCQQAMLDPHVTACVTQLKNRLLQSEFNVYNKDGKEDEEKSKIFGAKWFQDYLSDVWDKKLYGHSLIQFEDVIKVNGVEQFKEAELVPRIYVKPELSIVTANYADLKGVSYYDEPYRNWCISVGKKRDLGLLLKIIPLTIWKKNALGAWAEYMERFGVPTVIGKTDASDLVSTNKMEGMLKHLTVGAYGLFKTDDVIEVIESGKSDAYQVFDKMIDRCNTEISKLILGQTGTTDEKAFVGSAEVHERILKSLCDADLQEIYTINNTQLLPLMNNLGFGLEGYYLDVEQEDEFDLEQKSKFDIELLKTGKFTFTPEYIKEKYGTEVVPVTEPTEPTNISNSLKQYYE